MPSSITNQFFAFNAKLRKWTRTPRNWTKKPVIGTLAFTLGWVYHGWMTLVWWTSRVDVTGLDEIERSLDEERGVVAALYHESILIGPYTVRHLNSITIVNRSESGNLIAGILRRMNFTVIRGGSSRGKSRHKEVMGDLAARLKQERREPVFIAVDGSHGPARVVKPGIVALAKRVDAPLFIFHGASSLAVRLPSWDRTLIPLPFSRIIVRFHGPIEPREAGRRIPTEVLHQRMQHEIDQLVQQTSEDLKAKR
ncbi:lysophospholipid acyltransferase family protein [Algisphaera agarilytica]|uniref:DUF374 domain-containing protein n=1 Tax=Algisphaera agarilytica TaxID=1385975 RepID=A0A7X0LJY4_9BACT|nr:DUF374 domain-containing protein [Algisphaera agarilytica]MBB6428403.1 hypothetical protein [Algisphaera agarilytica]